MEENTPVITSLVPFLPVRDVERSAAFYKLLGFEVGNRVPREGKMGWAWLYMPQAADWRR
jgi:predicted lactoylglutathione lyase